MANVKIFVHREKIKVFLLLNVLLKHFVKLEVFVHVKSTSFPN